MSGCREFKQKVRCPNCGHRFSAENPFSQWLREQAEPDEALDATKYPLSFTDIDYFEHMFKTTVDGVGNGTRDVQYAMYIELKTHGAELPKAQEDDLFAVDQTTRTVRWRNQTERDEDGRFITGHPQNVVPLWIWSQMARKMVQLIHYGVFVLTLSGDRPDKSEKMTWRSILLHKDREITMDQLVNLLRFDLDPHTLRKNEHRRRKRKRAKAALLPWESNGKAVTT